MTSHNMSDNPQTNTIDKPRDSKDDELPLQQKSLNRAHSKPTVMISAYSECSSKFRFSAWNHRRQLNRKQDDQTEEDQLHRQHQQQLEHQQENSATKSDQSTEFFSQLKRRSHCSVPNYSSSSQSTLSGSVHCNKILIDLSQIKGPTGSVRGHKDVVRKSLEGIRVANSRRTGLLSTFMSGPSSNQSNTNWVSLNSSLASGNYLSLNSFNYNGSKLMSLQQIDEQLCSEYLERLVEDEQDHCVAYTTTLGVIRRTFDDSKLMKSILNLNLIKYEERDIYLNQEYKCQLKMRCSSIIVPALFVDGHHIGGAKELELMNESGDLRKVLAKFKMSGPARDVCLCCGNAKFIACPSCNGSRKSTIHHFKFNSIALRCIKCDKNDGLVQCPACHNSGPSSQHGIGQEFNDKLVKSSAGEPNQVQQQLQRQQQQVSLKANNEENSASTEGSQIYDNKEGKIPDPAEHFINLDENNNDDNNTNREQMNFLIGDKDNQADRKLDLNDSKRQVSTC